jgi:asparagine synthase (glutamine-hydrolysing)
MCGIVGFYSLQKKFNNTDLQKMTDCLQHRGPDANGYFLSEERTCGLGHRRLSIIDLSEAANQPMYSHSGRYVIVFNGEVYNFQEIKKQLNLPTSTTSDTEIIIEAFEQKGVDCVHLFNGMFALAIYDKSAKSLFLFRDRLGVKPLYFFSHQGNFAFASEIKSLMQADFVKDNVKVYKPSIYTFLYTGYLPEPFTIHDKIQKLPAGSYAIITNNSFEITSYWKAEEKIEAQVRSDFELAKKELKELLTSSVRYRMISDVPFGTFLSGGIDSSVVTALAQSISEKPVKTFSIGFKESKFNESEYAKKVSNHLGTQHHEFIVTEADAMELIDKMMSAYDEPYADSSAIPTMLISKLARKHVTMTLSGDGGDELFLGYGMYNWAKRLDNPMVKLLRKPLSFSLSQLGNRFKRAARVFDYRNESHKKSHLFSQEQYFFSEDELDELLGNDFKSELLFKEEFETKRKLSAIEEQALFDIKYYLKDDLLVKVDIASMQFSLETRTPFLDYRLVEFALNLSEDLKRKNGVSKYLLKELLYDYVPKEIFDRPKWGFSIPLANWLKKDLHYLIEKYLSEEMIRKYSMVKYEKVKSLIQRFENGADFLFNRLWALILLHKWMDDANRKL